MLVVGSEAVVYNEVHLMYAGGMAAAASGVSIELLFERFIFEPGEQSRRISSVLLRWSVRTDTRCVVWVAGMVSTRWASAGGRPLLGSGLSTTPEDYGRFLDSYFNGRLVSLETRAEMERSHYPGATLTGVATLQGRYGLGVRATLCTYQSPTLKYASSRL